MISALQEYLADAKFRGDAGNLRLPPDLYGLNHRLEVALHLGQAQFEGVNQVEVLGVFRDDGFIVAGEGCVIATEDPVAESHRESH